MEIYFGDLTKAAQKRLLKEACIKKPQDANWDVFPIGDVIFEDPSTYENENWDDDGDKEYDDGYDEEE